MELIETSIKKVVIGQDAVRRITGKRLTDLPIFMGRKGSFPTTSLNLRSKPIVFLNLTTSQVFQKKLGLL